MPRKLSTILHLCLITALVVGFGVLYFNDHAWGTWGDDSAGYIYLAGRMVQGEPLVYQDELATKGIEYFGDEKLARWLTPTHHQFINPNGTIASKYPIGASLVLYAASVLAGDSRAFYYVIPTLATVNLVLLYILGLQLFRFSRFRHVIAGLSAFGLGISNLYYDYAIAQPMREIPSITFMLLSALLLFGLRAENRWVKVLPAAGSALAFGMAFNIRETAAMITPALAVLAFGLLWQKKLSIKENFKKAAPYAAVFFITSVIAIIPTIMNSIDISQNKVAFKARDTGNVVLLSNIGHLETLTFSNIFNSEGKFRPGKGSLEHYIDVMERAVPLPYFLALVGLGLILLWRKSRMEAAFLFLWCFGILLIFSMWINPYSRYILPMFPMLMLLAVYGGVGFFVELAPKLFSRKSLQALMLLAVIGAGVFAYQPKVLDAQENLQEDVYRFKAISRNDLEQLYDIGEKLEGEKAVLLFTGDWQYGTSETLEAHTGLKTIRFPYDQRFVFDKEETDAFLEQLIEEYELYVWLDGTSSIEAVEWAANYTKETVWEGDFTFQPETAIISTEITQDTQ